jgi:hypothetical protein
MRSTIQVRKCDKCGDGGEGDHAPLLYYISISARDASAEIVFKDERPNTKPLHLFKDGSNAGVIEVCAQCLIGTGLVHEVHVPPRFKDSVVADAI